MNRDLFVNSRQFELNPVGDLHAILQYLHFDSIDELVVLNVTRGDKNIAQFAEQVRSLSRFCFVPISAGGGIESIDDCQLLLESGADKLVINSSLHDRPDLVRQMAEVYGSQCVVLSMDVRQRRDGRYVVYADNGSRATGWDPVSLARHAEQNGVGEIFLTSIDRDGTGKGYDVNLVRIVTEAVTVPVIASGGVGHFQHLVEGIVDGRASAVAAANIFHFIGQGLKKAKEYAQNKGLDVPAPLWNFKRDHLAG